MKAIVTGQVGVDKGPFLQAVVQAAAQRGMQIKVCSVGEMMYKEALDVPAGRILNLPITRLNALRRAVFKEILRLAHEHEHLIVSTHATFRWRHGLFSAFDFDQMQALSANFFITLLDNAENVHHRLARDHQDLDHTLKDIMVWREEEILATEILANILRFGRFYMLGRGRGNVAAQTMARLLTDRLSRKVYVSFPMSHVMDMPDILQKIDEFKATMREHFVVFDPAEVDEYHLHLLANQAHAAGQASFSVEATDGPVTLKTDEVMQISSDIMGQIYARDFKMIDQADMIVSLVPELPGGKPGLSSGVERELHHAFETGKEVYVIWACSAHPSPFITETATQVFRSMDEALDYFRRKRYIAAPAVPDPAAPTSLF